jgi:hypothetical protein
MSCSPRRAGRARTTPSEGFREQLVAALAYFGVEDVRLDA